MTFKTAMIKFTQYAQKLNFDEIFMGYIMVKAKF